MTTPGGGPGSALGVSLGVDAIEEFSIITSNPPADYGKTSGGSINAVTREGTNQIHGSAYEFRRNSALDVRNYFDGPAIGLAWNYPPKAHNKEKGLSRLRNAARGEKKITIGTQKPLLDVRVPSGTLTCLSSFAAALV
jgi:hypothetical protein